MDNKYISDFQIIGSSIKSLTIKNDFVSMPNNNSVKRKLGVTHEICSIDVNEEEEIYTGILLLNIDVTASMEKQRYKLKLAIEGCFNAPTNMPKETFEHMMTVNGITSLYSIARGFIQSVTAQTLLDGSILIPMINVVEYSEQIGESNPEN